MKMITLWEMKDQRQKENWRHLGRHHSLPLSALCFVFHELFPELVVVATSGIVTIQMSLQCLDNPGPTHLQRLQKWRWIFLSWSFNVQLYIKAKNDNWMKNSSQDKMEEARFAREREMEALMVARSQAIEEEEMERAAEEAERRLSQLRLYILSQ